MATRRTRKSKINYAVHPGVKKAQDWIARLPRKTGRSLEGWLAIIQKCAPQGSRARQAWLKNKHAFGTLEAAWLAGRAEGRGLEECDGKAYLAAADKYVDALFAEPRAALRPLYEALLAFGSAMGKDVTASPCKTFVPLYRRHVFAQIKPATWTRIDLGLALGKAAARLPKRLISTGGAAKGDRITHRIAISSARDLDDFVKCWMKKAYDLDA